MALSHSPGVVTDGLTLYYDAASLKSFRGINATNISNILNNNQQSDQNSTNYKITNGSEIVNIPGIGTLTSKYVDIYNNYSGGSGVCCPNLFSYGTGLAVTGSTTYTYSIIYKTVTGYTHPNYMYRYEYNSSGTYLIEGGVFSDSNRISLGDGWYFAWGQFTTQSTAATINTFLFHYEYSTYNRVYVAKAAIYQGSFVIPYQHFLNTGEVRGTTVATGGGCTDLSGNGNHGQLVNGVSEDSSNLGSLVFDGVNDYMDISTTLSNQFSKKSITVSTFAKISSVVSKNNLLSFNGAFNFFLPGNRLGPTQQLYWDSTTGWKGGTTTTWVTNQWYNLVWVISSGKDILFYINGSLDYTSTIGVNFSPTSNAAVRIGLSNAGEYATGNIATTQIYNRALTAAEVLQNFNALRGRYGI